VPHKDIERRAANLARAPGVANAEVSGEKHTATVVFDDQKTTVAAPIPATTNAGYAGKRFRRPLALKCLA
jgi:copper chaperone CopZ